MKTVAAVYGCVLACLCWTGAAAQTSSPMKGLFVMDGTSLGNTNAAAPSSSVRGNAAADTQAGPATARPKGDPERVFQMRSVLQSDNLTHGNLRSRLVPAGSGYEALKALVDEAGLQLVLVGSRSGDWLSLPTTYRTGGPLEDVLDTLSDAMKFFYQIRGERVFILREQQFSVSLPSYLSRNTEEALTQDLQAMGAKNIYVDREGHVLVFKSGKRSIHEIGAHLRRLQDAMAGSEADGQAAPSSLAYTGK